MADLNQPQNSNPAEYRPAAIAPMQGNSGLNGPYGDAVVQPYMSGQSDMYHNPGKFGHTPSFIRPPVENPLNNPNLIGYNMPTYQGTVPNRPVGKTVEDIQPHPGGNVPPPYGYPSTSQGTVPLRPALPPGADVTYSSNVNHFQMYSSSGMSSTPQSLSHVIGPSMQHLPAGGTGIANGPGSQNYQINSGEVIPNGPTKFMKQQQPHPPTVRMPPNLEPSRQQLSAIPPRQFPPKAVIAGSSPTPTSDSTSPSLGPSNLPNMLPLPRDSTHSRSTGLSPASTSPSISGPPSSKSSRNPSPIPTQRYDAMEGQFSSGPSPAVSCSSLQNANPQGRPLGQATFNSMAQMPPSQTNSSSLGVQTQSSIPVNVPSNQNYPPTIHSNNLPPSGLPPCSIPSSESSVQASQYPPRSIIPPTVGLQSNTSVTRSGLIGSRRTYPQPNSYPQPSVPNVIPPIPPGMNYPNTMVNSGGQKMQNQIPPISTAVGPISTQPSSFHYSGGQIPPVSTAVGSVNNQVSNYGYSGNQIPPVSTTDSTNQSSSYGSGGNQLAQQMSSLNLQGSGPIDLLHYRNVLPPVPVEPPRIVLAYQEYKNVNCSTDLFRCTLTKIPETQALLQKARLPLGILIHPFKDLNHLPVIQCTTIVRCRSCRTYINPFVYFVDHKRWKCNLCFRVNELPEEFQYDPVSKSYGDPSRRPEIKSATIEFIAPSEYMLRPPQPAVYLFLLDVSHLATETGYLRIFCEVLLESLDKLPGDGRTRVGFITYDSAIHFYNLAEGLSQPQMMVVSDIDDIFLPCPDNLLVNLQESKELITDTLTHLPLKFVDNKEPDSALGAALQAAFKLMAPTGGRVTVMQVSIPNMGPGALKPREDPNQRAAKDVQNLGPANDFYKKLSLDCSGQQIAVDLFVLASQYVDISTLSCISKYSGGCIHYYPGMHSLLNASQTERFENDLRRYLTRKVGFEAVMRIRCTKGLSIHTFHGNFFVRSTDLLSLPNINPDAGFGMQVSIEEHLNETQSACFQAALLYTSSKGERRIRVHTLCLPVSNNLLDILGGADQQTVVGLLAKMAVDRSLTTSMSDARDALINACIDALGVYRSTQSVGHGALLAPSSLRLLPLYVLGLLKHMAFRVGTSTRLDERVFAMNQMKTLPLNYLMLSIYPSLYAVHALDDRNAIMHEEKTIPQPPLLQLSAEKVDSHGAYLMDTGDAMYLYICRAIHDHFCQAVLNASNYSSINDRMTELPELETPESENLRNFVSYLQSQRPFSSVFLVIRDDSKSRHLFLQHLVDDRSESTFSYFEFLQHLKQQISK